MTVASVGSSPSSQTTSVSVKGGKSPKAEKSAEPKLKPQGAEPASASKTKGIAVEPQPSDEPAPPSTVDELSLSRRGLALGHEPTVQQTSIVDHQPIVNNTTVNNYYYGNAEGTGAGGSAAGANPATADVSSNFAALTDRLDTLTKQLDDLGGAVKKFESLVLDFEDRLGKLEQGKGAVINANFRIEGLSFDNLNVALKFARKGFNVLDILNAAGGSQHSAKLANASESLNRGLESLKSQSKNLLDQRNPLVGFFSTNLGSTLNQAV